MYYSAVDLKSERDIWAPTTWYAYTYEVGAGKHWVPRFSFESINDEDHALSVAVKFYPSLKPTFLLKIEKTFTPDPAAPSCTAESIPKLTCPNKYEPQ